MYVSVSMNSLSLYLMAFNRLQLDKNTATGAQSASMTVFTAEEQIDSTSTNWRRLEKNMKVCAPSCWVMLGHCSCWHHCFKMPLIERKAGLMKLASSVATLIFKYKACRCQNIHTLRQAKVFLVGLRQKQGSARALPGLVVHCSLSHLANMTHGGNRLLREFAAGSFTGKHHDICAI